MVLWELGAVATSEGDLGRAGELLSEGLRVSRDVGDRGRVRWYLQAFARLALAQDQPYRAVLLERAASVLGYTLLRDQVQVGRSGRAGGWQWSVMGLSSIAGDYALLESQLHAASLRLGEHRSAEARNAARDMTLDEAIAYATSTGDSGTVEAHAAGKLSPRQLEVAVLVAQGLTNRQIGERLVVTEAAAAKHVEHILDKLGAGTRAQIAAWAAERGLVTTPPD
jgi:non-specific serine/threonine protein kinase